MRQMKELNFKGKEIVPKPVSYSLKKLMTADSVPGTKLSPVSAVYEWLGRTDAPWSTQQGGV